MICIKKNTSTGRREILIEANEGQKFTIFNNKSGLLIREL